jgi:hypothetical protein
MAGLATALALAAHTVAAQTDPVPFKAGERFSYNVKFGSLRVGSATLALTGSDTAHGKSVLHVLLAVQGSAL